MASAGGFFSPEEACEGCGSLTFSQEWFNAFGVALCNSCKKEEKLISKTVAKEQYLLTDRDLKPLSCMTKPNPQKKQWSGMKLYLESQVRDVARTKHGSLSNVEEARHAKVQARLDERLRKRTAEESAGEGDGTNAKASRVQALQEKLRERLKAEYEDAGSGSPHEVPGVEAEEI